MHDKMVCFLLCSYDFTSRIIIQHALLLLDCIVRISWVQIDGTSYCGINDIVVLSYELLPTFGIIEDILFVNSTHFLYIMSYSHNVL